MGCKIKKIKKCSEPRENSKTGQDDKWTEDELRVSVCLRYCWFKGKTGKKPLEMKYIVIAFCE